jgi:hypothetical protein
MSVKSESYCPKCDYVTDWTLKTNPDATIYWACDQCLSKKSATEPTPKPLYQVLRKVKFLEQFGYNGSIHRVILSELGAEIICPLSPTHAMCRDSCMWLTIDSGVILCKGVPVAELVEEKGDTDE